MSHAIKSMHISMIRQGDTIVHDGIMRTVSGTDIKHDPCMGRTIFGDSYALGYKLVKVVTFYKAA